MAFRKYDHCERLGHDEVEGIDLGEVYVFPKLDGTNSSAWIGYVYADDEGGSTLPEVGCGSRTRQLSEGNDNAGFHRWVNDAAQRPLWQRLIRVGGACWTLYGEWMVAHTLKTYRSDVWRRFWVFDVYDNELGRYLPYSAYAPTLKEIGFDVIEPLCIITNPTEAQLRKEVDINTYLIIDGGGAGEGIVIKNYDWTSKYGRQPWAKIVRNEFKEDNKRAFGITEKSGKFQVEAALAERYVTQVIVEKALHKIEQDVLNNHDFGIEDQSLPNQVRRRKAVLEGARPQTIPRLLQTVFYDLIREDLWDGLKKYGFPTVDFRRLRSHTILRVKQFAPDLF
ncbi:MAG: RNA ligase family protein [Planctomycetes bacterium]|nr:RNA ligase family protein [Planctomycetota bacterium]